MPRYLEVTVDGDADTIRKLVTGVHAWPELIPSIRSVDHCNWTDKGEIARVTALRRQIPVRSRCLFATIGEGWCFRVFYLDGAASGLVESWRVRDRDNGPVRLVVTIGAWRGARNPVRLVARCLVVAPMVQHRLEMIALLAEADYLAHSEAEPGCVFDPAASSLQDFRDDVG